MSEDKLTQGVKQKGCRSSLATVSRRKDQQEPSLLLLQLIVVFSLTYREAYLDAKVEY